MTNLAKTGRSRRQPINQKSKWGQKKKVELFHMGLSVADLLSKMFRPWINDSLFLPSTEIPGDIENSMVVKTRRAVVLFLVVVIVLLFAGPETEALCIQHPGRGGRNYEAHRRS